MVIVAILAVAMVLADISPASAGPSSVSETLVLGPLVRANGYQATVIPHGEKKERPLSENRELHVDFIFSSSNQPGLNQTLQNLYNPASPTYHKWLSPGQFQSQFGPQESVVSDFQTWLASRGIGPGKFDGFSLSLEAPVSRVDDALGIQIYQYRQADSRIVYAPREPPLVPRALSSDLLGVLGLDDVTQIDSANDLSQVTLNSAFPNSPARSHVDATAAIGAYYGISGLNRAGLTGTGEKIAAVELAALEPSDITGFASGEENVGQPISNSIYYESVDGGATYDFNNDGTLEADMDVEELALYAPGATITSYQAPNSSIGQYDDFAAIINSDAANVITTSWGECEYDANYDGESSSLDGLFQRAAAQGESVFAAAGDSGSEGCWLSDFIPNSTQTYTTYPASDPYVTAVGGTTLSSSGEVVWNNCEGQVGTGCAVSNGGKGAGGGGVSHYWPRPSWQESFSTTYWNSPTPPCGTYCRAVPDLSANAGSGYDIYYNGEWTTNAGTSAASPLVAGLFADIDQGCSGPIGNLNPGLYSYAQNGIYGYGLNDITVGDNDLTRSYSPPDYQAYSGYDLASGLGSPIAQGLECPSVTSIQPSEAQAGQQVVVAGTNLRFATLYFGSEPAEVVSSSATSQTVIVPQVTGTVALGAETPIGAGTATSSFTVGNPGTLNISSPSSNVNINGDVQLTVSGSNLTSGSTVSVEIPGGYSQQTCGAVSSSGTVSCSVSYSSTTAGTFQFEAIDGSTVSGLVSVTWSSPPPGYWMLAQNGNVYAFGSAGSLGSATCGTATAIGATPRGNGYWVACSNGAVQSFGVASDFQVSNVPSSTVVSIASTCDGQGYWLATASGQVLLAGDARFFGDASQLNLKMGIVDMVATPDCGGYWLLGGDGGVFSYGDAGFFGSTGGLTLNSPAVAMAPVTNGQGYWIVASDGGLFAFGDATFLGSTYQINPNLPAGGLNSAAPVSAPINAIVMTADGKGYWMGASDGGVFSFGDAGFVGSLGGQTIQSPIVSMAS